MQTISISKTCEGAGGLPSSAALPRRAHRRLDACRHLRGVLAPAHLHNQPAPPAAAGAGGGGGGGSRGRKQQRKMKCSPPAWRVRHPRWERARRQLTKTRAPGRRAPALRRLGAAQGLLQGAAAAAAAAVAAARRLQVYAQRASSVPHPVEVGRRAAVVQVGCWEGAGRRGWRRLPGGCPAGAGERMRSPAMNTPGRCAPTRSPLGLAASSGLRARGQHHAAAVGARNAALALRRCPGPLGLTPPCLCGPPEPDGELDAGQRHPDLPKLGGEQPLPRAEPQHQVLPLDVHLHAVLGTTATRGAGKANAAEILALMVQQRLQRQRARARRQTRRRITTPGTGPASAPSSAPRTRAPAACAPCSARGRGRRRREAQQP